MIFANVLTIIILSSIYWRIPHPAWPLQLISNEFN